MREWDVVFRVCKCVAGNQLKSTQLVGGKVKSLHRVPCKVLTKKTTTTTTNVTRPPLTSRIHQRPTMLFGFLPQNTSNF